MRAWAIRGIEGNDGSAEAKAVLDELTSIERAITDVGMKVTEVEFADETPPPGLHESS